MYRQLVLRSTHPAKYPGACRLPVVSRKLTTTPPLSQGQSGPGQTPPAHPEGSNTLIILSALGALGGLYYYYTRGQPAADRETARRMEEETERKVRQFDEVGTSRVETAAKQGQREYNEAKGTVQDAAAAARTRATEARTDLSERAQQSAHEAQAKLDAWKDTAQRKMNDVRDRSEKKMEESKGEIARQAREAENKTRGWFGWGSSK
ncbi:hypothetical protein J3R82DRAFT_10149 [Butyriboletus roseoflavus]|nr:hypothetical protein J3R82DRAFT_10149 [Butyriboletus roseoflavus]